MDPPQLLASGVQQLKIDASTRQQELLMQFVKLLQKWNKTYNLTAIENSEEIISKHILDSLSVATHLAGKNIIDIGSGAGLPGIPLAIICQDTHFMLLDSNVKKTRFIQQAAIDLRLKNVQTVHQRLEDFQPDDIPPDGFNTVVSRAFMSSDKFFAHSKHLLKHLQDNGRIIFMLGKQKQLQALPNRYNVIDIYSVKIPQLEAQRHIAVVKKIGK